ncbi:MAG: ribosome-associated translation inhibitor RaiA [Firmicutes bacterium]|nr:ribosome-associated translation inhibitor RaiA [Bacillota bacterium]
MIIEFLAKNYEASDKLKDVIVRKVDKLDKFFESDTKVKVLLKESKDVYTLELTILLGSDVLRAEVSSDNMYGNIDVAVPKLEKQIIKHHKRLISKSKKIREKLPHESEVEKHSAVVKSKKYRLIPMTQDEAIEELELVGHSFYVFMNKDSGAVNVIYRRNDGDYGLIETDVS